ncbi:MAG: MogA/MoaB family molybdenum cofactor biosynthesis protein [Candidatus Acidiferrales bacterium]|jgi:molybdopterin adenylyltransferase
MRIAIITVSDSVSCGTREDLSGAALRKRCADLGWQIVATEILADDQNSIRALLIKICDSGDADVILTTGGTGVGPRDVTPEATSAAAKRMVPGIGERMREVGGRGFSRAYLSRATAGVRASTLIVNLPGSPKGAVESLNAVSDLLPHAVEVLRGARHD